MCPWPKKGKRKVFKSKALVPRRDQMACTGVNNTKGKGEKKNENWSRTEKGRGENRTGKEAKRPQLRVLKEG